MYCNDIFLRLKKEDSNHIAVRFFRATISIKRITMVARYLKSDDKKKPEERYPPIEVDDMIKIRASFSRLTPTKLQDEFAFNCLYYTSAFEVGKLSGTSNEIHLK